MSFVIFDTEYTSWKGCLENGWVGTQKKEIVQIAAIRVSDKFEVLDTFNELCVPKFNPVLSDYFVELTHITNEQVKLKGISFAIAYENFCKFVGNDVCFSHSWGGEYCSKTDGGIIEDNLTLYGLEHKHNIVFRNIAAVFKELYRRKNIEIRSQASGDIVRLLNIEESLEKLKLNSHNSLYDVFSILEGLKYFRDDIVLLNEKEFILR